jgi:hypothetical protein
MSDTDLRLNGRTRRTQARARDAQARDDCKARGGETGGGKGPRAEIARIGAFFASSWLAAAALYLGRHSVGLIAVSAVLVFAGFDLFRPE